MNEKMLLERLEQDIDRLLDGHSLPNDADLDDEYHQAMEAARLLSQHDLSGESQIRKALRQELLVRISDRRKVWSPKEKGTYTMKPRNKLLVLVETLVVILGVVISISPVRAFAQELLRQVGPLIIVSQPEIPLEELPADFKPTPVPDSGRPNEPLPESTSHTLNFGKNSNGQEAFSGQPTPVPVDPRLQSITPQEALTRLNFRVLMPTYIPNGYALIVPPNFVQVQPDRIVSSMVYITDDDAYLSIAQSTFDEQGKVPFSIGDAEATEITVRGQKAILVKDAMRMTVQDANGQNITLPVDYLMWEEDGFFFMMDATELTQEEMIKVAESLE